MYPISAKITTILLCAGRGSRLKSYTNDIPKCMTKINGRSLLNYQIDQIEKHCLLNLVVGYKSQIIKNEFGSKYKIYENLNYESTNMLYSLFCCAELFNDKLLISYGDIVYTEKTLIKLLQSEFDITIASDSNFFEYWSQRSENPMDDLETFISEGNNLIEIGKKTNDVKKIMGQYIGLIKLSKKGAEIFKNYYNKNINEFRKYDMTSFLNFLLKKNIKINIIPFTDPWVEIDSVKDLLSNITLKRLQSIDKKNCQN